MLLLTLRWFVNIPSTNPAATYLVAFKYYEILILVFVYILKPLRISGT